VAQGLFCKSSGVHRLQRKVHQPPFEKRPTAVHCPDQEEIEKQPGLQQLETTNQAAISPATNYRLLPNSTEFDIHAPSAGMVCLTEGQAKDFTALANNEPKEVLTVNRAFKGIYLDQPGDYHISSSTVPALAAGLRLFLDFSRRGHLWALTSIIRAKVQRKGGANPLMKTIRRMNHPSTERHPAKACHVCGGARFYYLFSASDYRVVRCDDCGLVFLNPQPSDDELARIYGADYFLGQQHRKRLPGRQGNQAGHRQALSFGNLPLLRP
jgi:hypothetical protein